MNEKIRVRFGVRLFWPIANAGTLVLNVTEPQYLAGAKVVENVRVWLNAVNQVEFAKRLIYEES